MKKIIVSFILSSIIFVNIYAQTESIRGRVFDYKTKEALPGVNVYVLINNNAIAAQTDSIGHYILRNLYPGTYTIYFSYIGYKRDSITNIKVETNKITFINDIFLVSIINDLSIIEDYWYEDNLINNENHERLKYFEFEKIPFRRNISQLINVITPGAYIKNGGDEISVRGSRNGGLVYYVDGIRTLNNKIGIPNKSIKSMTVYIGSVPAKYGDFDGGVVEIETKNYTDK